MTRSILSNWAKAGGSGPPATSRVHVCLCVGFDVRQPSRQKLMTSLRWQWQYPEPRTTEGRHKKCTQRVYLWFSHILFSLVRVIGRTMPIHEIMKVFFSWESLYFKDIVATALCDITTGQHLLFCHLVEIVFFFLNTECCLSLFGLIGTVDQNVKERSEFRISSRTLERCGCICTSSSGRDHVALVPF